jgi:hypothetical protein
MRIGRAAIGDPHVWDSSRRLDGARLDWSRALDAPPTRTTVAVARATLLGRLGHGEWRRGDDGIEDRTGEAGQVHRGADAHRGEIGFKPAISGAAAEVAHVLQEAPTGVAVAPHLEPAEFFLGTNDVHSGITQPSQRAHRRGGQVGQEVLRQGEGAQLLPQRGTERHLVGTLGDAGRTKRRRTTPKRGSRRRMTSKPLPPRLKAWLEGSGAA